MIRATDPSAVRTFDADDRVFTVAPRKLAFYERANDNAYLATDAALDLHDWR